MLLTLSSYINMLGQPHNRVDYQLIKLISHYSLKREETFLTAQKSVYDFTTISQRSVDHTFMQSGFNYDFAVAPTILNVTYMEMKTYHCNTWKSGYHRHDGVRRSQTLSYFVVSYCSKQNTVKGSCSSWVQCSIADLRYNQVITFYNLKNIYKKEWSLDVAVISYNCILKIIVNSLVLNDERLTGCTEVDCCRQPNMMFPVQITTQGQSYILDRYCSW